MGNATFYPWRDQYGGMETSDSKPVKQLEAENRKLKQLLAELCLKAQLQEKSIKKFWYPLRQVKLGLCN
ncbi:MAG: transposase [Snodgrassella sp.]|nr:transposase [Snodgrassella sp.]